MTEQELGQFLWIDRLLRNMESAGEIHETPQGWKRGEHPYPAALKRAWQERMGRESEAERVALPPPC